MIERPYAFFAEWLRACLAERGLSHDAAGKLLGVPTGTVTRWLSGRHVPRPPHMDKILAEFGEPRLGPSPTSHSRMESDGETQVPWLVAVG